MTRRRTRPEQQELLAFVTSQKLQQVPPALILSQLVTDHGMSLRHARRYLALASETVHQQGIPAPADPFDATAAMALQRLQLAMISATPAELPRLIAALAKLREVASAGPTLADDDIIQRAAFMGGLAKE